MDDKSNLTQFTEVTAVFNRYPQPIQGKLWELRALVLETAVSTPGVGKIVETLKWNQPSFLTVKPKSGTTIRLDAHDVTQNQIGLYVHCQTNLIDTFRQQCPTLTYDGNRAIVLDARDPLPLDALQACISLALTYHSRKRKRAKGNGT
ncbi:DUF1801 domain-containing protein [Candidatus Leptofilum sp.]|uniref:DUF1801 domain-containing protein n=1 Tax=Candidatus Leptofilum sp. TaxID=3241576 RepID=UPI003B593BAE